MSTSIDAAIIIHDSPELAASYQHPYWVKPFKLKRVDGCLYWVGDEARMIGSRDGYPTYEETLESLKKIDSHIHILNTVYERTLRIYNDLILPYEEFPL